MYALPLPGRNRRLGVLAATAAAHLLLILVWQTGRRLSPLQADSPRMDVQWIAPPARAIPAASTPSARPATPERDRPLPLQPRIQSPSQPRLQPPAPPAGADSAATLATPAVPALPATAPPAADPFAGVDAGPAADKAVGMGAAANPILERARRDVGAIDRSLRKGNKPLIVAPPDSKQLRLQRDIEEAAEMAPNRWYETPKQAELVNNTGDGARRTRVITGFGTYCVTERSGRAGIDMIEKHGKNSITTCPKHERPPKRQEWHTANE